MKLYTIGHSDHESSRLIALLTQHGIEAVCDVRSVPQSQWTPQHNRDNLRKILKEQGIGYVWLGDTLGGRPQGNQYYTDNGHVKYHVMAESDSFATGYARLRKGATTMRIVVLCAEENPQNCHRRLLIARVADNDGWNIQHIRGNGTLISETELKTQDPQMPLFGDNEWLSAKPVR